MRILVCLLASAIFLGVNASTVFAQPPPTASLTVTTAICSTVTGVQCRGGDNTLDNATIDFNVYFGSTGPIGPIQKTITVVIVGFGGSEAQNLPIFHGYSICEVPIAHTEFSGDVALSVIPAPLSIAGQLVVPGFPLCISTNTGKVSRTALGRFLNTRAPAGLVLGPGR